MATLSQLKERLKADIGIMHSRCFLVIDHHGPGYVGYFQAYATRQADGSWRLIQRKMEPKGDDGHETGLIQPVKVVSFEDAIKELDFFERQYQIFGTVPSMIEGLHFKRARDLVNNHAAARLHALRHFGRKAPAPH